MRDLFECAVFVCGQGYRWDHNHEVSQNDKTPLLVPNRPPGSSTEAWEQATVYDPLQKYPGLFLDFARVEPTKEAILAFANVYGNLYLDLDEDRGADNSLTTWQDTIARMGDLVDLWQAVKTKDTDSLKRHVRWTRARKLETLSRVQKIMSDVGGPWPCFDPSEEFRYPDLLEPATCLFDGALQAAMPNVSLAVGREEERRLGIRVPLHDLYDSLWIQFILAVVGNKVYRYCETCDRAIELSSRITRNDRRFCSDTCRVTAYYRRRAKARTMRAEGKHLREIAKVVGSNMKTVKKWLGES